jgi:hypothetical protein
VRRGGTIVLSKIGVSSTESIHLVKSVRKDARESRGHAADQIEHCITFLKIISGVPTTEKIGTTGEKASLEDSEN